MTTVSGRWSSDQPWWDRLFCVQDRPFCAQECAERCHGEGEENESYDDFVPVNYLDEMPIAKMPHVVTTHYREESPSTRGQPPSWLPWADLNGTQQRSVLSSHEAKHRRPSRSRDDPTDRMLLPCSTYSQLPALPAPRFITGIPIKACKYEADPTDPIDVEISRNLRMLDAESGQVLGLRRVRPGCYEIDGRQVVVYYGGLGTRHLLVHEDEVGGSSIADMPLPAYIELVANVAVSLQGRGALAVASALTFVEAGRGSSVRDSDGEDRYRAMRIACTQAKLRENASRVGSTASAAASYHFAR